MTDLVIYGIGPFARLMQFYFTHDSQYRVVAFTADEQYLSGSTAYGLTAVPFDQVATRFPPECVRMFVAIGYRRMRARRKLFERAKALNYSMVNYIGRRAITYPDLQMGENNVAMAGVVFEPFVRVGDNNVFWSGTLICHDAEVGSHNYIGARCVIGGNSILRDGCFVGNGAVLINGIELAGETHILPGATLLCSTREARRYMGNPAREAGSHEEHGIVIERG